MSDEVAEARIKLLSIIKQVQGGLQFKEKGETGEVKAKSYTLSSRKTIQGSDGPIDYFVREIENRCDQKDMLERRSNDNLNFLSMKM